MSVVTVQIGQCGNQIGGEVFAAIHHDNTTLQKVVDGKANRLYVKASDERFFRRQEDAVGRERCHARAVLVDMEEKAVEQTVLAARRQAGWSYDPGQAYCGRRGSGNNWAYGYHSHGGACREAVLELVRREVEHCDHFGGFLTVQSVAGGTGSGVGARLSAALRAEYPHSVIVSQAVLPNAAGEVSVQSYNAVLTLAHLYNTSDAVVLTQNDALHAICRQRLGLAQVSLHDMNTVIAHQLASVLQPVTHSGSLVRNPLAALTAHLCAHPMYKLLSVRSTPIVAKDVQDFSSYAWPGLVKHMRQMLIANTVMEDGIDWSITANSPSDYFSHSVANLLLLRGSCPEPIDLVSFSAPQLYPPWLPVWGAFQAWHQPRPIARYDKSLTLVSNSQLPLAPLDTTVAKAWGMFAARAYVHQYLAHGLTEEDFVDAFACLEQVVADYKALG